VIVSLSRRLVDYSALLEQIIGVGSAANRVTIIEVNLDVLTETGGIVVTKSLNRQPYSRSERCQNRRRFAAFLLYFFVA
jgi:hypothetical protein